jgi:hypothetical protein
MENCTKCFSQVVGYRASVVRIERLLKGVDCEATEYFCIWEVIRRNAISVLVKYAFNMALTGSIHGSSLQEPGSSPTGPGSESL